MKFTQKIRSLRYLLSHKWQSIKDFFNPQTKFALKAVGKSWKDCDGIIEDVLIACLISFVESEKGLEYYGTDEYCDNLKSDFFTPEGIEEIRKCRIELLEAYEFFKTGRAALEKQVEDAQPRNKEGKTAGDLFADYISSKGKSKEYLFFTAPVGDFDNSYAKVLELEEKIQDETSKHLHSIVKYRGYMWT